METTIMPMPMPNLACFFMPSTLPNILNLSHRRGSCCELRHEFAGCHLIQPESSARAREEQFRAQVLIFQSGTQGVHFLAHYHYLFRLERAPNLRGDRIETLFRRLLPFRRVVPIAGAFQKMR